MRKRHNGIRMANVVSTISKGAVQRLKIEKFKINCHRKNTNVAIPSVLEVARYCGRTLILTSIALMVSPAAQATKINACVNNNSGQVQIIDNDATEADCKNNETFTSWNEVGIQGPSGNDGADGPQGDPGPQGIAGNDGADGAQGPQGDPGPQGIAGNDGTDGAQGLQGDPGPQGIAGDDGVDGADGSSCSVDDDGAGLATLECTDGSSVSFAIPFCGNGIIEAGEMCDDPSDSSCANCLQLAVLAFPGSALVNETEGDQINSWIGSPGTEWTRCYSAANDGFSNLAFHTQCDGKGPTVFVSLLSTGNKIGGYATASWGGGSGYVGSAANFLFSLTNNFKHSHYRYTNYQYKQPSYGPTFGGGHDFYSNLDGTSGSYCNIGHTYQCRVGSYTTSQCRNDFCGVYTPGINDLEVWHQ